MSIFLHEQLYGTDAVMLTVAVACEAVVSFAATE